VNEMITDNSFDALCLKPNDYLSLLHQDTVIITSPCLIGPGGGVVTIYRDIVVSQKTRQV